MDEIAINTEAFFESGYPVATGAQTSFDAFNDILDYILNEAFQSFFLDLGIFRSFFSNFKNEIINEMMNEMMNEIWLLGASHNQTSKFESKKSMKCGKDFCYRKSLDTNKICKPGTLFFSRVKIQFDSEN